MSQNQKSEKNRISCVPGRQPRVPAPSRANTYGGSRYFVTTSVPFMIPEWPGKEQK